MIKLEKTSNLIEALVEQHGVVIWNEEIKRMAEESDAELNEVVRLADIGRATEKAMVDGILLPNAVYTGSGYEEGVGDPLLSVEELLEWAKGCK